MTKSQRYNNNEISMISRVLNSDWFALLVVVTSAILLGLLYLKQKTTEATIGGILLTIAIVLIILGRGHDSKK